MIRFLLSIAAAISTACFSAVQAADPKVQFVFSLDAVCSTTGSTECISIGHPWNKDALKKAFPAQAVEFSNECDGPCFILKSKSGSLNVFGHKGKVSRISSRDGSGDFKGNKIGERLSKAIEKEALCANGEEVVCLGDGNIGYIVDGCDNLKLFEKLNNDFSTMIAPECAKIGGLELIDQKAKVERRSTATPARTDARGEDSSKRQSNAEPPTVFAEYPTKESFDGRVRVPDFEGRDRKVREYRTAIKRYISKNSRSNFAGRYSLVPITQTGGATFALIEAATGKVLWVETMIGQYYDFAYSRSSRLLLFQWSNGEECYLEPFVMESSKLRRLILPKKTTIDKDGNCADRLPHSSRERKSAQDDLKRVVAPSSRPSDGPVSQSPIASKSVREPQGAEQRAEAGVVVKTSSDVPKCSDGNVIDAVARHLDRQGSPVGLQYTVTNARPTAFDSEIKVRTCRATIAVKYEAVHPDNVLGQIAARGAAQIAVIKDSSVDYRVQILENGHEFVEVIRYD